MIVSCKKRRVICRRYPYYRTSRILFDPSTANGEELSGLWNDCTHLEDLEAISCHRSFAAACVFQIELLAATRRDATRRDATRQWRFIHVPFSPGRTFKFYFHFFLGAWYLRLARRWIAIKSDFQMFGKVSLPWKFQWFRGNFARDDFIPPAPAVVRNFDSLLPRWHDEFISPF